ncbi:Panacea domain-containing protein [Aquicoccus sp. G2-2]|uniref:Panacea domain-containing protein n=1 Tax=Aquicoccus sp. G2-2 TaxID=3092120 RepID=UPI00366FC44C
MGYDTTNLELQKLLFFCHSNHLLNTKTRLMSGYFEAWDYGPVHPIVYRAFKVFKGQPIQFEAQNVDPFTKKELPVPDTLSAEEKTSISSTVSSLSRFTAAQLVDLSHRPDGPWSAVVAKASEGTVLGMRITDELIISCARNSRIVSSDTISSRVGRAAEPDGVRYYVEEPIAGYGPG